MIPVITLFIIAFPSTSLQQQIIDGVMCDCMKSIRCKPWLSAVNSSNYLQLPVCGYDETSFQPLIWCPRNDGDWIKKAHRTKRDISQGLQNIQLSCTITSHTKSSVGLANQKCAQYAEAVFQSGFEISIAGSPFKAEKKDTCFRNEEGDDTAQPREFPHAALIGYNEMNITWRCGGTLISERFVLSAAHCAETRLGIARWVVLGEFDISTDEETARPQTYKISRRIVHPDYNVAQLYHDIALFKLNRDVKFTIYVRPACLFTKSDPPEDKAYTIGWGRKSVGSSPSEVPKKIEMEIWSTEDCNKSFNTITQRLSDGIKADIMICSNETHLAQGAACQGDSGGPLQVALSDPYCMYGILGVMSYIKGCGYSHPTVFTRLFKYLPWIVDTVWPDEYL